MIDNPFIPMTERYTANFDPGLVEKRNIFIHCTRGKGGSLDAEYTSTTAWMMRKSTDASPVPSAHFVVGPTEITRMVKDGNRAWHAEEANAFALSIEIAQPETQPPFVDFQYRATAAICRNWCELYGIPKVRVMSQASRGIIGHQDSEQGKRWGKIDPGWRWNWPYFMGLVDNIAGGNGLTEEQIKQVLVQLNDMWTVAAVLEDQANGLRAAVIRNKEVLGISDRVV